VNRRSLIKRALGLLGIAVVGKAKPEEVVVYELYVPGEPVRVVEPLTDEQVAAFEQISTDICPRSGTRPHRALKKRTGTLVPELGGLVGSRWARGGAAKGRR